MIAERVIIHMADISDARQSGGRLRAGCPVHGSDRQRSLSIQAEGDYTGFGHCHACGAEVLVLEMNPDAARRLEARGQSVLTAEKLLRPVKHHLAEQQDWQRAELAALQSLDERMRRALLASERARAYLAERCIPLEIAEAQGIGYLPPAWQDRPELRALQKWIDRIIFPLASPMGAGYAGRSLAGWHPGIDENEHKRLLNEPGQPERWRKSYPAGWYGYGDLAPDMPQIIMVEGPFDRLALLAAGFSPDDVLALVGSKESRAEWIPAHIERVLVALDGDTTGQASAQGIQQKLYTGGILARTCIPPDDGLGKDWSERWRRGAHDALEPLFEALQALEGNLAAEG